MDDSEAVDRKAAGQQLIEEMSATKNSIGRYDMNKFGKRNVILLYEKWYIHQPEEVRWRKWQKETQMDGQQTATDFFTAKPCHVD